jgi:hypothetical protein
MKKITYLIAIAAFLTICSCSKNVSGGIEKTDRVAQLFQQVKGDSKFIDYCKMLMSYRDAFMANGKKSVENQRRTGKSDSAVLFDKSLSMEQKYKRLGYDNYALVMGNTMKMYELQKYISNTYPLWKELTQEENVRFAKIAVNYIKNINQ